MALRERFDVVMSEDVVSGLVPSDQFEERFFVGGGVEDLSPRKAFCRRNVVGNVAGSDGLIRVGARLFLVRRDGVGRVVAFSDVVSHPEEIVGAVFDDFNVWMEISEVKGGHSPLESLAEADDGMVVVSSVSMRLSRNLAPVEVGEGGEEFSQRVFADFPVRDLGVGEEEALSIEARRHVLRGTLVAVPPFIVRRERPRL